MNATESRFATAPDGGAVTLFVLENENGVRLSAMSHGATLVGVEVPGPNGTRVNLVLSHGTLEEYVKDTEFLGCIVGRFANRIARGSFVLDGKRYTLACNDGPNAMHGGLRGFDKVGWNGRLFRKGDEAGIRFSYTSPQGEEGYPGTLVVDAEYALTEKNELSMEYWATCDAPTPVNITNHSYWNLAGAGAGTVLAHEVSFNCPFYLPSNEDLVPTGEVLATAGTPFDFSVPKAIGKDMDAVPGGYDHCLVIDKPSGALGLACTARDPASGRTMKVFTTKPGVQFYTGNFLHSDKHPRHSGFCVETQHFPDAPNRGHFPSSILRPGETYHQRTVHELVLENPDA